MIRATAVKSVSGTPSAHSFRGQLPGEPMGKKHEKDSIDKSAHGHDASHKIDADESENENPPRTTSKGWFTTPKFGSSTSGGGEIEPGPERD